ncbi:hypothetical protein BGZ83_000971 [Gryganskiella cystojenkinii]|nr:hypothetical protein BGZ83_000971 [Gryganskiella cystojenkinii]
MSINRGHFLKILYEVIIFEYMAMNYAGDTISPSDLAECFDTVCSVYHDYNLDYPCDKYIRRHGLDDEDYVMSFIEDIEPELFPSFACFKSRPQRYKDERRRDPYFDKDDWDCYERDAYESSISSSQETDSDAESDETEYSYAGYEVISDSYYGEPGVTLPRWNNSAIQDFLWSYTNLVPLHYMNDISVLIYELRDRLWHDRGSGGTWSDVHDDLCGVTKFTRERSEEKLGIPTQQEQQRQYLAQQRRAAEEAEQERIRQEQEQERIRKEQERIRKQQQDGNNKIETYLQNLVKSTKATPTREEEIWDLRTRLTGHMYDYYGDRSIKVWLFGSYYTGLSSRDSDADFTVIDERERIESIHELAQCLWDMGYQKVVTIANARVPIVTFYDPVTKTDCDISINHPLGEMNSKLIKTYSQIDDRFVPLWFGLRQLAKRHNILSGSSAPVLPALQDQPNMVAATVEGWDCSFDRNWSNQRKNGTANTKTVAGLLKSFCLYFGYDFDYGTMEVNARVGVLRKRNLGSAQNNSQRQKLSRAAMSVVDPFERNRNVAANCNASRVLQIQHVFQMAGDALSRGDIDTAFAR